MKLSSGLGTALLVMLGSLACKPSANTMKINSDIVANLHVSPTSLRLADIADFEIGFTAINRGHRSQDPHCSQYSLEVNGVPSITFGLAVSNGKREAKWFDLPPGDTVGLTWKTMGASLFPKAGEYALTLKTPFGNTDSTRVVVLD